MWSRLVFHKDLDPETSVHLITDELCAGMHKRPARKHTCISHTLTHSHSCFTDAFCGILYVPEMLLSRSLPVDMKLYISNKKKVFLVMLVQTGLCYVQMHK